MIDNCVIVASMGRSGSTALYNSIAKTVGYSSRNIRFVKRLDDCDYEKGKIYKTHDFPPDNAPDHAKFIWTFADPYEVMLSVINQESNDDFSIKQHFYNLRANYNFYHNVYYADVMRLEEHFDQWYREHSFDLLTVKYHSIWNRERDISRFIGISFNLPPFFPRQERINKIDEHKRELLGNTYKDLYEKVERAEDIKIWE